MVIQRIGKTGGAALDALERAGGELELSALAAVLGSSKRLRDLRRRAVSRLVDAGVVECFGDTVSLTADWLESLALERERSGEIDAHRRDMARYARESAAFNDRHRHRVEPVPKRPPPRSPLRDVSHMVEVDPPPIPEPPGALVAALAYYLSRSPKRREETPSWLAVALWAGELVREKPEPRAVAAALAILDASFAGDLWGVA